MKSRLALAALVLVTSGCSSVGPLQPLSGGTARQAWEELSRATAEAGTLASFASVRVATSQGRRSFRATIEAGGSGEIRMRAFTPVGTEVFAFSVSGGEMVFVDHWAKKSWRGPFSEVASQLGIPAGVEAADFARLVFGLPAGGGEADLSRVGEGIVRQGDLEYELSGMGLAAVARSGSAWRVRFEPGSFPPEKVTFDDLDGRSIVVRHLDLSHSKKPVEPLVVDPSYACCFRPVIGRE